MIDKILKDSWTGRINKTFPNTAQKEKFSIIDFFSKCDQTRWKLRIWSHLLKKALMENFIFCAVTASHFKPWLFTISVKAKVPFRRFSEIKRENTVEWFLFNYWEVGLAFSFSMDSSKNHSDEILQSSAQKALAIRQKIVF